LSLTGKQPEFMTGGHNMKFKLIAGILGCCVVGFASVSQASEEATDNNVKPMVGMPNPAAKICADLGGENKTYTLRSGAQTSLCKFADEEFLAGYMGEWTLARNYARQETSQAVKAYFEHVEYQAPDGGMVGHPAKQYCEQLGGEQQIIKDELGESGICRFEDGSVIEEWTLFRGPEIHKNLTEALKQFMPEDNQDQ